MRNPRAAVLVNPHAVLPANEARRSVGDADPKRRRHDEPRAAGGRGLDAAEGAFVLLLDARVRLEPDALRFVHTRVDAGEDVWNAHVHVRGGPFATFWRLLAELAWREYFDDPRTTRFGVESFDRY